MRSRLALLILCAGLLFSNCGTITHVKGLHPAVQPLAVKKRTQNHLKVEVRFTDQHEYDLKDADQGDFNKLIGRQHDRDPHASTAMLGWRFFEAQFQVMPYFHTECKDDHGEGWYAVGAYEGWINNDNLFVCEKGKWYTFYITVTSDSFIISGEGGYETELCHGRGGEDTYRTLTWFGGNKTAPKTMPLDLRYSWENKKNYSKN